MLLLLAAAVFAQQATETMTSPASFDGSIHETKENRIARLLANKTASLEAEIEASRFIISEIKRRSNAHALSESSNLTRLKKAKGAWSSSSSKHAATTSSSRSAKTPKSHLSEDGLIDSKLATQIVSLSAQKLTQEAIITELQLKFPDLDSHEVNSLIVNSHIQTGTTSALKQDDTSKAKAKAFAIKMAQQQLQE